MIILLVVLLFPEGPASGMVSGTATDTAGAERVLPFSEGLAAICREGSWGYINTSGEQAVKCIFSRAGAFGNKRAPVRVDQKWGYISPRGRFVVNPRFDEAMPFSDGVAAVRQGKLWGLIDTRGKMVQDYSYEGLKEFHEGVAPAMRQGKWGFIDLGGTFVIRRTWSDAGEFGEGLAAVKDPEGHWGYIDHKGAIYIDSQFDEAGVFSEGLAPVRIGSRWGYVNWKGKLVISPQFEQAGGFSGKLAAVKIRGKWGYIDATGVEMIPATFARAGEFGNGFAPVEDNDLAYFIDKWGEKSLDIEIKVTIPAGSLTGAQGNAGIPGALSADIYYVSPANCMGKTGKPYRDEVIYLIRIHGSGLNQDQLFTNGLNGFRYEISTVGETGNGNYFTRAYPLNGAVYSEEAGGPKAALDPRDIAFYWKGPRSDSSGRSVRIVQYVRDFSNSKNIRLGDSLVLTLPPRVTPKRLQKEYKIILTRLEGSSFFNGVCAFPLQVKILDGGSPAPQEIYDRLVFYPIDEEGKYNLKQVIGADPADTVSLAVIASAWGRMESGKWKAASGDPHFGYSRIHAASPGPDYRLFHLFAMPAENAARKISVQILSAAGDSVLAEKLFVLNRLKSEARLSEPLPGDQNSEAAGRIIKLVADDPDFSHSDPSGGNFDFVFDSQKKFIIPVMPEGFNARSISDRFNFSRFIAGFYLTPNYEMNRVTSFTVTDRTSSLFSTCGKIIYGYLFDIFGKYNQTPLFTDNEKKMVRHYVSKTSFRDESMTIRWESPPIARVEEDGGPRFMIALYKQHKRPLLVEVSGLTEGQDWGKYKEKKYPATKILTGPLTTPGYNNISYATGDDQYLYGETRMTWNMEGFSVATGTRYFSDRLRLQKSKAGSGGRIQMNSEIFINNPPFEHCIEFGVDYTDKELRAACWEISCREVRCTGFGIIKGSDWKKWVEGGTFKGQINKSTFDEGAWNPW
jgi:hypothetical protein